MPYWVDLKDMGDRYTHTEHSTPIFQGEYYRTGGVGGGD